MSNTHGMARSDARKDAETLHTYDGAQARFQGTRTQLELRPYDAEQVRLWLGLRQSAFEYMAGSYWIEVDVAQLLLDLARLFPAVFADVVLSLEARAEEGEEVSA